MPGKQVHTYIYTDGYRYDGLQVGVHAYECGADALLTYRYEEVGDECSAYDEECEFSKICRG